MPPAMLPPGRVRRAVLRADQQAAVDSGVRHLRRPGTRGHIVSACGTGKTLIALRTAEGLGAQQVAVAVPSLDLIAQWARAMRADGRDEPILTVSSLRAQKHPLLADAGVHSTNTGEYLASWLARHKRTLVLFTYDSLSKIEQAQHAVTAAPVFDLLIVDEAHRTAGSWNKQWTALHDNARIPADRRLYLTATPSVWEAPTLAAAPTERPRPRRTPATAPEWEAPSLIASMDDPKVFGHRLHTFSHADAIEAGILADYQLLVPAITDDDLRTALRDQEVSAGFGAMARRTTALHLAVLKAMTDHDLHHVIVYFQQIADADDFARQFPHTLGRLPTDRRPDWAADLVVQSINGTHTPAQRHTILNRFADTDRAVLTNAQVLGEGIDLPAVDAVVFADRTASVRRVVQALGRALRKPATLDHKTASLIIPAYIPPAADPTDLLGTPFEALWLITVALRSHDQSIAALAPRNRANQRQEREARTLIARRFRFDFTLNPHHVAQAMDLIAWPASGAVPSAPRRAGLAAAIRYHTEHGHLRVPADFEDAYGHRLGAFIAGQRTAHRQGGLDDDWIAELEHLGMIWNERQAIWDGHLAEAETFHAIHGHLAIPDRQPGGQFLADQRTRARQGRLAPERAAQLDAIDPSWTVPHGADWHRKYHLLRRHLQAGHEPSALRRDTTAQGTKIGAWLHRQITTWNTLHHGQRTLLAGLGLTPDQVPQLAPASATDGRRRRTFEENAELLCLFVERHGRPPKAREWIDVDGNRVMIGPWLAKAATRQNAGELPDAHTRLLKEILPD